MKKKLVVLVGVVLVMCSLLCACGGSSASTITFSSGEILTTKEVTKLDNQYGYLDDDVTVEMTVKSIDAQWGYMYSKDNLQVSFSHLSVGTRLVPNDDIVEVVKTLSEGDRIKLTGKVGIIGTLAVNIEEVTSIQIIQ